MNIAIVGCGFVADYYLQIVAHHPQLSLLGVTDRYRTRARRFAHMHQLHLCHKCCFRSVQSPSSHQFVKNRLGYLRA